MGRHSNGDILCETKRWVVMSGFRRYVDEICVLLGYYAVSCRNLLLTFRDNESIPTLMVKKSKFSFYFLFELLDPLRWDQYIVQKRR
jgi:hypothetical protein